MASRASSCAALLTAAALAGGAHADSLLKDLVVLRSGETLIGVIVHDATKEALVLADDACALRRIERGEVGTVWPARRPAGWKPRCAFDAAVVRAASVAPARKDAGPLRLQMLPEPYVIPPPPPTSSYGFAVLAVDAAALLAFVAGGGDRTNALGVTGLLLYAVGAPAMHCFHARCGTALGSLALRVGVPIGMGAMLESTTSGGARSGLGVAAAGIGVGAASVMVVDWLVLSRREIREDEGIRVVSVAPIERGLAMSLRF